MQKAKHTTHEPYYCHHKVQVTTITVKSLIPYCDSFYNWNEIIAIKALPDKKYLVSILDAEDGSRGQFISINKATTDSAYTHYYTNGVIKFKGVAIDSGKFRYGTHHYKEGLFTYYDTQGRKRKEERFAESRLHGRYTEYDTNGFMSLEGNYYEGNQHGKFLYYDSTGKLKKEENYQHGDLNGDYKEYFANGKLKVKGWYYNNKKDGTWKYYTTTGKLLKSKKYKNKQEVIGYGVEEYLTWAYQDAEIAGLYFPNPEFDDFFRESIETYCNKRGIYLGEFDDEIDKVYLKINKENKISLVFYKGDGTHNELTVKPNWFFHSYPARQMGATGTSYFRVDYTIQTEYY